MFSNVAVEMTTNQIQQNISINLADDCLTLTDDGFVIHW